jgi:hypothetical protein
MDDIEIIEDLKKQLEEKKVGLIKHKNAFLKLFIVVSLSNFIVPFIPAARIVRLVEERGYWGTVIFGAPILFIVFIIVFYLQKIKIQDEIENIQKIINRKINQ